MPEDEDQYVVNIVERDTGAIIRSFPPRSERSARKLEDGASINLDHERFYTTITTPAVK